MSGKLIVLGRKKIMWTLVLLTGVMVPLLFAAYTVPVAQVTDPGTVMMTYTSEKEGFKFLYPQGWLLRTEKYFTGDIAESVSFSNPDATANGYVQVMLLKKPIPEYIAEAQKNMVPGYDSLQFSTKKIGNKDGYMLAYGRGSGDARKIAAEYFFRQNEKVYRFSCFYPEPQAEQYQKIFKEMLNSLTFPKTNEAQDQQSQNSSEQDNNINKTP